MSNLNPNDSITTQEAVKLVDCFLNRLEEAIWRETEKIAYFDALNKNATKVRIDVEHVEQMLERIYNEIEVKHDG